MKKKVIRQNVPKHVAAAQVFGNLYKLINDIHKNGLLEEAVCEDGSKAVLKASPAFKEFKDTYFPAAQYIKYWCLAWEKISELMKIELSNDNLLRFAEELEKDEPVFMESLLVLAEKELDAQRKAYIKVPEHILSKALAMIS